MVFPVVPDRLADVGAILRLREEHKSQGVRTSQVDLESRAIHPSNVLHRRIRPRAGSIETSTIHVTIRSDCLGNVATQRMASDVELLVPMKSSALQVETGRLLNGRSDSAATDRSPPRQILHDAFERDGASVRNDGDVTVFHIATSLYEVPGPPRLAKLLNNPPTLAIQRRVKFAPSLLVDETCAIHEPRANGQSSQQFVAAAEWGIFGKVPRALVAAQLADASAYGMSAYLKATAELRAECALRHGGQPPSMCVVRRWAVPRGRSTD
mmetsp:Transcript_2143/g.5275  ORF Transcript_2143/g.5275 Transcript_2143/m.5275 type:complete len:268 (+) Transcript_2143:269-1072(+)